MKHVPSPMTGQYNDENMHNITYMGSEVERKMDISADRETAVFLKANISVDLESIPKLT
jgi:hypothetical protein